MSAVINTNMFSIYAQRQTGVSQRASEVSMERLSSGERINSAKDDATGRAFVQHHTTQINGYTQSLQNTNNAASMVQVADSAMDSVTEVLQRMRELTLYSVSGAISNVDRGYLQNEFESLQDEITRLVQDTQFDGIPLLNRPEEQVNQNISFQLGGEFSSLVNLNSFQGETFETTTRGYYSGSPVTLDEDGQITVPDGGNLLVIEVDGVSSSVLNLTPATKTPDEWATELETAINADSQFGDEGVTVQFDSSSKQFVILSDSEGDGSTIEVTGSYLGGSLGIGAGMYDDTKGYAELITTEGIPAEQRTITVDIDHKPLVTVQLAETIKPVKVWMSDLEESVRGLDVSYDETAKKFTLSSMTGEEGTVGVWGGVAPFGLVVHDTSQVSMNHYDMDDPENALGALLLDNQSIATQVTAEGMLAKIDSAISFVDEGRAHFAAVENQLQSTAEGMELNRISSSEARSSLQDADFALESAELARAQIKQQVATAMMAQANQVPQQMLQMFA